ncbi:MAG: ABC transporter permease [Ruminococcaceae bacterium]|nr:ABC transporter permease [Oscillospiraceae bacterium]
MKRPKMLRRIQNPLLHMLFLALLSAAGIVFMLQYVLDGLALQQCLKTYAYVGSLRSESSEALPSELISALEASKNVEKLEIRASFAAKLTDAAVVPDFMMSNERLDQHYFIEGTVLSNQSRPQETTLVSDVYAVAIDKQWGSDSVKRTSMMLFLRRHRDEAPLEKGQKIFFIGDFVEEYNAVRTDRTSINLPSVWQELGVDHSDSPIKMHPLIVLPENLTAEETEDFILNFMEKNEILPIFEHYCTLNGQTTVREISDLSLLPYGASGRIYVDMGRALTEADRGKNVCMISQGMFLRNRLRVGDSITFSVSDGCFVLNNGYDSGLPMENETEPLTFLEEKTYEIVGIYHQFGRDFSDPLFYSVSDILIPLQGATTVARPYNCSFRVLGTNYNTFMSEFEPILSDYDYKLKFTDLGWKDVEDSFFAMQDRQILMLLCAALALLSAGIGFAILTHRHYRKEYALRRLLGAYRREARGCFVSGFFLAFVPGSLLAGICAWWIYRSYLLPSVTMPISMPNVLPLICAAAVFVGVCAYGFMRILINRTERHGILIPLKN